MTKVLLVYVNSFMDNLIPLGASILSGCLKDAGHKTKLFDTTFYRTSERTGDDVRVETLQILETDFNEFGIHEKETGMVDDFKLMIDDFQPDLIGFSVVETTYEIALQLLRGTRNYSIPKIVGGIHVTMSPDEVISQKEVDMICIGEGENAIVELADKIGKGEDYSHINNLWVKKKGKVIKNPVGPLVDLTSLPMQDWTIYEKERFYKPMGGKIWIAGPVELGRGCPFRCSFCCNAALQDIYKKKGHYRRLKSVERFIEEAKIKMKKYNLQYLYIVNENFLQMKDDYFEKFIEMYDEIHLPFWIETRPETVTLERAKKIRSVGCEGISIGVEHGNEQFRREVLNRFVPNDVMIKAFKTAKKSGIRVCANNIIGFPLETRELVFDTIELNRTLDADNVIVNIFCPYRGSKLWNLCVEKGYISKDALAGDYRGLDAGLDMPQLSRESIVELQRTFPLYVKFPKDMWPEIEKAENNDKKFRELSSEYRKKWMGVKEETATIPEC